MEEWRLPVSGATIALLLIGIIGTRVVTNMAAEVGFSYRPARNDSTVVTPWPKPIDTKNDIFEIGKVSTFKRELDAALGTRGMLQFIQEQPLTIEMLTIQLSFRILLCRECPLDGGSRACGKHRKFRQWARLPLHVRLL